MRSSKHSASALLPWYVNRSLSGAEEDSVRDHLDACAVCSGELDRLDAIARSMRESGVEISKDGERRAPAFRPSWRIWAVASSLAVIGSLALYQAVRSPRETGPGPVPARSDGRGTPARDAAGEPASAQQRPGIDSALVLDLGGGPLRGGWVAPVLEILPGIESVTFLFTVQIDVGARCVVALRGPDESLLHRQEMVLLTDPLGRVAVTVEASVFTEPGEYAVEVSGPSGGPVRPYLYPFRVGVSVEPSIQ